MHIKGTGCFYAYLKIRKEKGHIKRKRKYLSRSSYIIISKLYCSVNMIFFGMLQYSLCAFSIAVQRQFCNGKIIAACNDPCILNPLETSRIF